MFKKLTQKEKLEIAKQKVINARYEKYEVWHRNRYATDKLVGTMYLKDKMDYGFHIYFIYEPNKDNPTAGVNGTLAEMYYNLRTREYWIKRNLKEVQFSVRNVDSMFPSNSEDKEDMFDFLSTKSNEGLYQSAHNFLGAMGEERTEMIGRFFHRLVTEYSYYELLYKAGVAINGNVDIADRNGKSPREILGLTKTQWKMYSKYGVSINSLSKYNKSWINTSDGDKKAINYLSYVKQLEEEYGVEKINNFVDREFDIVYEQTSYYSTALKIARRYGLSEKRVIKYLYFECDVSQGLDYYNAMSQYNDYLRMVEDMRYERYEKYPKFLRTIHDIVARNYNIKLNEAQMEEWNEKLDNNNKFQYSHSGYKIFPPQNPDELVREGNILGHCVGSYVNKVRKGLSTVLFLRESMDLEQPLITIEVKGDAIIQARGKMNESAKGKHREVVKSFANKFNLKY